MSITPIIDVKKLEIKDKKLIEKYMKKFEDFYIPASEHDTFDEEILESDTFFKSSKIVGQHHPIEVAICEKDPYKESNSFHIHLRIIDGRHRWKQAIKHEVVWATKFYQVKDYAQYMQLRGHFDSKKQIQVSERKEYFSRLAKYYEEVLKIPRHQISSAICRDYSPTPFNEATIRRYLDTSFKDNKKIKACYMSVETRHPMPLKTILEKNPEQIRGDYSKYRYRISQLEEENDYLRTYIGKGKWDGEIFVLEELNRSAWGFVHTHIDKKEAMNELALLDPSKYRLRIIRATQELFYQPTTDLKVLQIRKNREYQLDWQKKLRSISE